MPISQGQAAWRERFENRHRYGQPLDATAPIGCTGGAIMARTIKLPARSNAQTFEPSEVLDVRLSLLNPDLPSGEGVVIADATDTAPKARVRNRNMVKQLQDPQTVPESDIPDEFWTGDENDEGEATLPEWIMEFALPVAEEDAEDAEPNYSLPEVSARAHTVHAEDGYLAVLSLKP